MGNTRKDRTAEIAAEKPPALAIARISGNGIGWAVEQMRRGARVRRRGWNSKGMFIFLVPGSRFEVNREPLLSAFAIGTMLDYQPHVDMRTADGTIVPWLCSQSDLLALDWEHPV